MKIRNSNIEIRNNLEIQMTQSSKQLLLTLVWNILILNI
jgi:hypothetical protein